MIFNLQNNSITIGEFTKSVNEKFNKLYAEYPMNINTLEKSIFKCIKETLNEYGFNDSKLNYLRKYFSFSYNCYVRKCVFLTSDTETPYAIMIKGKKYYFIEDEENGMRCNIDHNKKFKYIIKSAVIEVNLKYLDFEKNLDHHLIDCNIHLFSANYSNNGIMFYNKHNSYGYKNTLQQITLNTPIEEYVYCSILINISEIIHFNYFMIYNNTSFKSLFEHLAYRYSNKFSKYKIIQFEDFIKDYSIDYRIYDTYLKDRNILQYCIKNLKHLPFINNELKNMQEFMEMIKYDKDF